MSYLGPASFHFVRGVIKGTKGSDIANLVSQRFLRSVMLQVKLSVIKLVSKDVEPKIILKSF